MIANKFIKTIALLLGLWSFNSQGSAIYYKAIDLTDVTTGDDLWQYQYQIADASFLTDEGFDIYFRIDDGYQSGDLKGTATANGGWNIKAIQPDLFLPHDGFLDGQAGVDPSLQGLFYINFIWRGQGSTPGRQKYELYDNNFAITDKGWTQPFPGTSVPEPETLLLMLIGLGGYLVKHKTGKSTGYGAHHAPSILGAVTK